MRELPLKAGDTLLLCSDGFSSRVSEREIERVLADEARSVEEASRALLNLALSAGGAGGRENLAIEIARLARRTREPRRTREADYAENESPIPPRSPHAAEAPASEPETIEKPQAEIPLFRSFRSGIDVERDVERGQTRSSKWLMILSVVLAIPMLCVLIFMVVKAHSGAPFDPNLVTQPPSAAGDNQPQPNTQDPSHQVKVTVDQVPAGTAAEPASNSQPSNNERAVKPTEAQTETPTETSAGTSQDQPAAQTRIPPGSKQRAAANVPSSATSARAHAERPSGNEDTRPADREEASRPVAVSAEAAAGRLIESRIAIYPPVAKASGISGTVELEATISEDGTVKDLRAVSGPVQLRQAAVHAVSAWRYRPFMANNEPMEVRTTINVVFSLDR
jgi:TonB family protein